MIEILSRKQVIKEIKDSGGKIAAVYPIHYPRELFEAFGIHPIEVWGPPDINTESNFIHLQSYICSLMHSGLSFMISGKLQDADLIVVPHACDSLQGFGSILQDFLKPEVPLITFYIPRGKTNESLNFLINEIKRVYDILVKITGKNPTDETLIEYIEAEERIDELLEELYQKRHTLSLSSFEFYKIVRAREFLPPKIYENLLKEQFKYTNKDKTNKIRVILSGILPEPMELFNIIEEAGGFVVSDDLACCRRRIYGKGNSKNPFERMAERIVNGPPDSTKGSSFDERFRFLERLVKENKAKGIIFYNVKFCEPEYFYHPILREKLSDIGIKSIIIETDINQPISQQIITRISAFLEVIEGDQ